MKLLVLKSGYSGCAGESDINIPYVVGTAGVIILTRSVRLLKRETLRGIAGVRSSMIPQRDIMALKSKLC